MSEIIILFRYFFFNGPLPAPFFFIFVFSTQLTVKNVQQTLPMTGVEPRSSRIESDRSTNWATQPLPYSDTFKWLIEISYQGLRFINDGGKIRTGA